MPARTETLHATPWLTLKSIHIPAEDGRNKVWTYASRPNCVGGVCVIARTAGSNPEILLVRQRRAPVDRLVIEFPAGLIDANESPLETALRELREETGWSGNATAVSPVTYTSPGLTDEVIYFVSVTVTVEGIPQPDEGEMIEVLRWPVAELQSRLHAAAAAGDGIDAKLWTYALAQI